MNAFRDQCLPVEQNSWDILEPYLRAKAFDGRFVRTAKGPLSLELQKTAGDVLVNSSREHVVCIEVKAERKHTGNLFIERWSNRSRFTPGWLETLHTDLLWYHFLDQDVVYVLPFQRMRQWMYWHTDTGRPKAHTFLLAEQKTYKQLNDTWGYLVPLKDLQEAKLIRDTFRPLGEAKSSAA